MCDKMGDDEIKKTRKIPVINLMNVYIITFSIFHVLLVNNVALRTEILDIVYEADSD